MSIERIPDIGRSVNVHILEKSLTDVTNVTFVILGAFGTHIINVAV